MKRIIISRTDAIGDVVLTLPLAGILKKSNAEVFFFGRNYTAPVIECCNHVDQFINYDDFLSLDKSGKADFLRKLNADSILHVYPRKDIAIAASQAGIPSRVGTSHRIYHWFNCNKLLHFTRKNSDLHEAQLNCKLLKGIGISDSYTLDELIQFNSITSKTAIREDVRSLLSRDKLNLILHPHSHGSGREWGLDNFKKLVILLLRSDFNVFISGSSKEKEQLASWMNELPDEVHDVTGKFNLQEFIAFINAADGLIACSTGPLHLAAALGRHALGIYPPFRPIHAGRWAPLGPKAQHITFGTHCNACKNNPASCSCITSIEPEAVMQLILQWNKS